MFRPEHRRGIGREGSIRSRARQKQPRLVIANAFTGITLESPAVRRIALDFYGTIHTSGNVSREQHSAHSASTNFMNPRRSILRGARERKRRSDGVSPNGNAENAVPPVRPLAAKGKSRAARWERMSIPLPAFLVCAIPSAAVKVPTRRNSRRYLQTLNPALINETPNGAKILRRPYSGNE